MSIRILHVLLSPKAEGTPRLVLDWLKNKEILQGVLFLNGSPADMIKEFELTCSNLYVFNIGYSGYFKFTKANRVVKETTNLFNPDLVIAWPQSFGSAIISGLKRKKISSILHIGCYPHYNSLFQIFYNYFVYFPTLFNSGKIVCASNFLHKRILQLPFIPKAKIFRIYNAINLERYTNSLNENSLIRRKGAIIVSNLESFKNQKFLLEVWSELKLSGYYYPLTIVGGGSMKEELESITNSLNLKDLVLFTGPVNNVPDFLIKHKVFMFPTAYTEGFGTVLIEALASGCKIIANDVPSCREVLENGKWGYLIPFLNKEKFKKRIIMEMENDSYLYGFSDLKIYLDKFKTEVMINNYLELVGLGKKNI